MLMGNHVVFQYTYTLQCLRCVKHIYFLKHSSFLPRDHKKPLLVMLDEKDWKLLLLLGQFC